MAIGACAIAWGLWWLPVRWLARSGLSGDLVSVAVYLGAALLLAPWMLGRRRAALRSGTTLLIGVLLGAALALTNDALLRGDVVRVLLLFYLAPVWATLLGALLLHVPLTLARCGCVVAGVAGAAAVLGAGAGVPRPTSIGDWMGLLAGIAFAAGSLAVRRSEQSGKGGDATSQTFASFVFAALIGAILVLQLSHASATSAVAVWSALPRALLVSLVWLIPQTWLFTWGARRLDPGRVSIIMLAEPMVAVLSAAVLLHERPSARVLLGCLLIVCAALIETAGARPAAA